MPISTKFYELYADSDGTELENIIGGAPGLNSGYILQVFISRVSGNATYIDFDIRYFSGDDSVVNLVCSFDRAELPDYPGIGINAPFDLKSKSTPNDLILYLKPEESGDFRIRIDFKFDG